MALAQAALEVSPARPEGVAAGDLVVRYTLANKPGTNKIDVAATVGALGNPAALTLEPEFNEWVGPVSPAVHTILEHSYGVTRAQMATIGQRMREGTEFTYGRTMLLRGLVTSQTEAEEAALDLTDNGRFRAAGEAWQRTVIGMSNFRLMQRALFVASASPEIDIPMPLERPSTNSEIRADIVNFVARQALDAFTVMPPEPKNP